MNFRPRKEYAAVDVKNGVFLAPVQSPVDTRNCLRPVAAASSSMAPEGNDTGQHSDCRVCNGRDQLVNHSLVMRCCPGRRLFPTTHPFKGKTSLCYASEGTRNICHSRSACILPPPPLPPLLSVHDIARPSVPLDDHSMAKPPPKQLLTPPSSGCYSWSMNGSSKNTTARNPVENHRARQTYPISRAVQQKCPLCLETVQKTLAEPINLCIDRDQQRESRCRSEVASANENLTGAPLWMKSSRSFNVESASGDHSPTSSGGESILRRVLMDAKTRSSRDLEGGVPGVVTDSHRSSATSYCTPPTPAGWNASTTNTAIRHGTMVQHKPSRPFDDISLPVDCCLGFQRIPSSTVHNFNNRRIKFTDDQWYATADQRYQPSMDDYSSEQHGTLSISGWPDANRRDAVIRVTVSGKGETPVRVACRSGYSTMASVEGTMIASSDRGNTESCHQFRRYSQSKEMCTSMKPSHSAFIPNDDSSAPSATACAFTHSRRTGSFAQGAVDRWQSMNRSADGLVGLASDRHSTSAAPVQQWMDEISTFATAYCKFAGLSSADHMTLLRRSRSRLLLLYMAEFNFRFSVESVSTVSAEWSNKSDSSSSLVTASSSTVAPKSVRQIQLFIERCRSLHINSKEYHYMRLIVLFHCGECELERPELVQRLNVNATQLLRKVSQNTNDSPFGATRRYADLMLHLRAAYNLESNAIKTMLLGPHASDDF